MCFINDYFNLKGLLKDSIEVYITMTKIFRNDRRFVYSKIAMNILYLIIQIYEY
ncbi:hypothetical protein LNA01_15010 [Companilactobacillus nantensis]|nr:hypothetical protein LNA01_15010 [Companilactobacillus nantensis]